MLEWFAARPGWAVTSSGREVLISREGDGPKPLAAGAVEAYRELRRSHAEGGQRLEALAARPLDVWSLLGLNLATTAGFFVGGAAGFLALVAFPDRWDAARAPAFLLSATFGLVLGAAAGVGLVALRHARPRRRLPAPSRPRGG